MPPRWLFTPCLCCLAAIGATGWAGTQATAQAVAATAPGRQASPALRGAGPVARRGLTLLMVNLPGCPHCQRWKTQIGHSYRHRASARRATLSVVAFDGPWPDGLVLAARPVVTPTFILLRDRQEVGRIEGYAGPDSFYRRLDALLDSAGSRANP